MNITMAAAKTAKVVYFCQRADGKEIRNKEEYERYLYKVIVQHLNVLDKNNWGQFEYLTWMAAVELYEIKHNLPSKLSNLRFELEQNHIGFFIEGKTKSIVESHIANLPNKFKRLGSIAEYEFYVYAITDEMLLKTRRNSFPPSEYNIDYFHDLVRLYELENNLPLLSEQLYCTDRFRYFRKLRQDLS
ncbi:hypothetical protein [Litorilituus lipolyticus]|uniref:Uncharacterized protein n=1 Tax=Litorilituus lipolyticus TaxID=2491017 RepID=A0A502L0P9_9GAMM|nr:hypothetical protein [Litorilituus lipolyticus]TPH15871.1 hypothetical protein EPA86_07840 [Litorilituus lipolyticus]